MAKKKILHISVSQENQDQAQQALEHYQQLAVQLRTITNPQQADSVLGEFNAMPEGAQIALLKALAKEHHVAAADVLLAVNEYSPNKNVRKEAHRCLIQLEGAKVYPLWEVPARPPVIQLLPPILAGPLPFWKGMVTDSFDLGEVHLGLAFEESPHRVRLLAFLLDFWGGGVKDFFTRLETRRSIDEYYAELSALSGEVPTRECSLAEGRKWILDALAVNQKLGIPPHKDYTRNLTLINQLVLESPELDEEELEDEDLDVFDYDESTEDIISSFDHDPEEVVYNFIRCWEEDEYDVAYDLLAENSPLREGLARDEWIEKRENWVEEVNPGELEVSFIHEREPRQPKIWLPNPFSASRSITKEIEVGWSLEMDEEAGEDAPADFPYATAVYAESGRRWFWTSYTLVQEEGRWRIQHMVDEGKNAELLSIEELQQKNQECDRFLQEHAQQYTPEQVTQFTNEESAEFARAIAWRLIQAIYNDDALLKKLPLDQALYEEAASRSLVLGELERSASYVEHMLEHFTDQQAELLRRLAYIYEQSSSKYFEAEDDERGERAQELAIKALRDSLAMEDDLDARLDLVQLLLGRKEDVDEAQEHLEQARSMTTEPKVEALIAFHMGEIATEQERYEDALQHYQHVTEMEPESAEAWTDIGKTYEKLEQFDEAEASYRHAIELQPDDEDGYWLLSKMFQESGREEQAIEAIEEGLIVNPKSAALNAYMASMYYELGDYRQAELFLDKAEELDAELELIPIFRQLLKVAKHKPSPIIDADRGPRAKNPKKKKKKR